MDEQNNEISVIYKIFNEIYSKAPPILKDLSDESIDIDYKECIKDHMDFKTIDKQFQNKKYFSLTDVIKDIRLVFLNCYTFYGIKSDYTLKSLELEELLEQKISCLDEPYKSLADIKLTFKVLDIEEKSHLKSKYPKDCYDSILLRSVAHCRPERLREYHKILSAKLTTNETDAHILEELITWQNEIYFNDHRKFINSMPELPEIGNFMAIVFKDLNIDIINQGEIERMFLMPKESTTMSKIMTILLESNKKKPKNIDDIMPYTVWSEKFSKKVSEWYKIYHSKNHDKVDVMNVLGIDPYFWTVFNDENPLDQCEFVELSYSKKVWLIKGLCDYVFNKHKIINDIIRNCYEKQITIWKNDMETEEYFYFSSMPDLRIYYHNIPYDEPNVEFLDFGKIKNEMKKDVTLDSGITDVLNADRQLNEENFKVIADSVQGLRSFIDELNTYDSSVPDDLIDSLEKFLMKIEPEECNLIVLNNSSKIKLFKDWKLYSEKEKLQFDEKEVKPSDFGEECMERCKRKAAIKQKFTFDDPIFDSEEYFSDTDSICDYTDSDDEWGLMNQPNNKNKETIQKSSKLYELEERKKIKLPKEPKCVVQRIKNLYDEPPTKRMRADVDKQDLDVLVTKETIQKSSKLYELKERKKIKLPKEPKCVAQRIKNLYDEPPTKRMRADVDKQDLDVLVLDDNDNSDSCEIVSETIIPDSSVKTIIDSKNPTTDKDIGPNKNKEVIVIEDEEIVISDDDDIKLISVTPKKSNSLGNNNVYRSPNLFSKNRQVTSSNVRNPRLVPRTRAGANLQNVPILPTNLNLPKGIQISVVNKPPKITSHFNVTKRPTFRSNNHQMDNTQTVNVKCKVISKPNNNGEVKFCIELPNGNQHPVANDLINDYLKQHNHILPDYLFIPLSKDLVKQHGFQ